MCLLLKTWASIIKLKVWGVSDEIKALKALFHRHLSDTKSINYIIKKFIYYLFITELITKLIISALMWTFTTTPDLVHSTGQFETRRYTHWCDPETRSRICRRTSWLRAHGGHKWWRATGGEHCSWRKTLSSPAPPPEPPAGPARWQFSAHTARHPTRGTEERKGGSQINSQRGWYDNQRMNQVKLNVFAPCRAFSSRLKSEQCDGSGFICVVCVV